MPLFLEVDDRALRGLQAGFDGASFEFVGDEADPAFVQRVKTGVDCVGGMAVNGDDADVFGVLVLFVPQGHIAVRAGIDVLRNVNITCDPLAG